MAEKFTSYGIRELQIFPIDDTGAYGAGVLADGVSAFSETPTVTNTDLVGSDRVIDTKSILEAYELSFETGFWEFNVLNILDSSAQSVDGKVLTTAAGDKKKPYGVLARVFVEDGDDLVIAFPYVKTNQITAGYASQQHAKCAVTAKALAHPTTNVFKKMIRHKGALIEDLFTATAGTTVTP